MPSATGILQLIGRQKPKQAKDVMKTIKQAYGERTEKPDKKGSK